MTTLQGGVATSSKISLNMGRGKFVNVASVDLYSDNDNGAQYRYSKIRGSGAY